jgi:hypothetical protein
MRIRKDHYEAMAIGMGETFDKHPSLLYDYRRWYMTDKRLAWDVLRNSEVGGLKGIQFVCDVLYKYLNDSHIDTALLKILKKQESRGLKHGQRD